MAAPKRELLIRCYFIDPISGQVLKASMALLDGLMARRRFVPDWAGLKVRMVQVIATVSGERMQITDVKGSHMHFEGEGFWDQPREAQAAIALLELASRYRDQDDNHRRRFVERRVAASRWHVAGETIAVMQSDIDGGKRAKGRPPWRWAPGAKIASDLD
jgi:hypothetical protein